MLKIPSKALLSASVIIGLSQSVQAQPFTQIVAFGDSLTDSGQYPDLMSPMVTIPVGMGNTVTLPSGTLRFTNRESPLYQAPSPFAEIAIQRASRALGLGELHPSTSAIPGAVSGQFAGTNYAKGGSTTAEILSSIVAEDGSVTRHPATGAELNRRHGYLVEHPTVSANHLYYINGGANDIFDGLVSDSASAGLSAANLAAGFNALNDAGGRYIMVSNLPDIGSTPLGFAQDQLAAGEGEEQDDAASLALTELSQLFNQSLYQEIEQSDANIIPLDVAALLREVTSDPTRFGFSGNNDRPTDTCFDASGPSTVCIEDPTYGLSSGNASPDRLVFFDGVHPTAAGQQIIADYMTSILTAPAEVALLPVLSMQLAAKNMDRTLAGLARSRQFAPLNDWQATLAVDDTDNEVHNSAYDVSLRGDSRAATLAAQKKFNPHWLAGSSISIGEGASDGARTATRVEQESVSVSLYGSFTEDRYFSDAIVSFSQVRFGTIKRHAPLGLDSERVEEADSDGTVISGVLSAGYDLSFDGGRWRYGPRLTVGAAKSEVDGFAEYSGSATALAFEQQSLRSLYAEPGLFIDYRSTNGLLSFTGQFGLRTELEMNHRETAARLQTLDAIKFYLPGYEHADKQSVNAQAQLSYSPSPHSRLFVQYLTENGQHRMEMLGLGLVYNF